MSRSDAHVPLRAGDPDYDPILYMNARNKQKRCCTSVTAATVVVLTIVAAAVACIAVLLLLLFIKPAQPSIDDSVLEQCPFVRYRYGYRPLTTDASPPHPPTPQPFATLHSAFESEAPPVLIRGATVFVGDGSVLNSQDLLLKNGTISAIGASGSITAPDNAVLVEAAGRIVTPGLVDAHSHMGVHALPDFAARSDVNEGTDPSTPQVRAIDSFDPDDIAIPAILTGGVTTANVMPGSANVIGGEGVLVKLRVPSVQLTEATNQQRPHISMSDLLLSGADDSKPPVRSLKIALGENPKGRYKGKGQLPSTRMGTAWVLRNSLSRARALMFAQDEWCARNQKYYTSKSEPLPLSSTAAFEALAAESLPFEPLISLLRTNRRKDSGRDTATAAPEVRVHVHCYETADIEAAIRVLTREFGVRIAAVHHAIEAFKVRGLLAAYKVAAAVFADLWGAKVESYDASVYTPKLLHESGVDVVIKSDHPVLFAQNLIYQAGKAHYYGLDEQTAIQAVTLNAARVLGVDDKVGSLHVGKHADIVLWNTHPLSLGARPAMVWIDGRLYHQSTVQFRSASTSQEPTHSRRRHHVVDQSPQVANAASVASTASIGQCTPNARLTAADYAITGLTAVFADDASDSWPRTAPTAEESLTIVVTGGNVTCVGSPVQCPVPSGHTVHSFAGSNAVATPGFIEAAVSGTFGHREIGNEASTSEGSTSDVVNTMDLVGGDGVRFLDLRHVQYAAGAGVTAALAAPPTTALLGGSVSLFRTIHHNDDQRERVVAVKLAIGNAAATKSGASASVAGQWAVLRSAFDAARTSSDSSPAATRLLARTLLPQSSEQHLPVVFAANHRDDIAAALRLQQQYGITAMTIVGGAEAWMHANQLAAANVAVVLVGATATTRLMPKGFDTLQWHPLAAAILKQAGVRVSIAVGDADFVRNLRWEAGLLTALDASDRPITAGSAYAPVSPPPPLHPDVAANAALSDADALAAITRNVADALHLPSGFGRIRLGTEANLVILTRTSASASPLTFESTPALVAVNSALWCSPRQD